MQQQNRESSITFDPEVGLRWGLNHCKVHNPAHKSATRTTFRQLRGTNRLWLKNKQNKKKIFQGQDSFLGCNRPIRRKISSVASEKSLVNASVDPPDIALGEPLAKFYFWKVFWKLQVGNYLGTGEAWVGKATTKAIRHPHPTTPLTTPQGGRGMVPEKHNGSPVGYPVLERTISKESVRICMERFFSLEMPNKQTTTTQLMRLSWITFWESTHMAWIWYRH